MSAKTWDPDGCDVPAIYSESPIEQIMLGEMLRRLPAETKRWSVVK
jgi:hypothetical protein